MPPDDLYSALRDDLYFPGRGGDFFYSDEHKTDVVLCVEMARLSYCRREPSFAFDRDRISAALAEVEFTPYQFFESGKGPKCEGTHAFLALKKDGNGNQRLALVSFRGTDKDDPTDIGDDANAILAPWSGTGKVHQGFAKALGDVQAELDLVLQDIKCRILFTGHSLGAALATLLASTWQPNLLCTIGSPRVGDAEFVDSLKKVEVRRFVDCCDVVTRVPPDWMKYEHVGEPYYIEWNRRITLNPTGEFINEDRVRAEADYLEKYAWKIGNVGVRDLADHAPVNYVRAVRANQSPL